jgi:hypothetical protein
MQLHRFETYRTLTLGGAWAALALAAACSSSSNTPDGGGALRNVGGDGATVPSVDAAVACSAPGSVPSGPATTRCDLADGGLLVQPVSAASCMVGGDAGDDGTCSYGDTLFGHEGPDDDCKYQVSWTSTPLCESMPLGNGNFGPGVVFTVVATYLGTTMPLTGAQTHIEYYLTEPDEAGADASFCDDITVHPGPSSIATGLYEMTETTPGTYVGEIAFDAPGAWTLRFHFNEDCLDILPDSPHGHAAFHLLLP